MGSHLVDRLMKDGHEVTNNTDNTKFLTECY